MRRALAESDGKIIEKSPKTRNGRRNIEIDAGLVAQLSRHQEVMDAHRAKLGPRWNAKDWLFVQRNGGALAPRALNQRFAGLLERAALHGRGYGIHTCRHTHISQLLMRNVPLIIVSRRAGHASVATTMNKYGHLISQMSEGVVESHLQEIQQNWV